MYFKRYGVEVRGVGSKHLYYTVTVVDFNKLAVPNANRDSKIAQLRRNWRRGTTNCTIIRELRIKMMFEKG